MKQSEIKIGETYLFVATDSVTRKHLEGKPFEVVRKEKVWRKLKKRRAYVYRFFNEQGDGARAEELEPICDLQKLGQAITGISEAFKKAGSAMKVFGASGSWNGHPATAPASDYEVNNDGLPF